MKREKKIKSQFLQKIIKLTNLCEVASPPPQRDAQIISGLKKFKGQEWRSYKH